MHIRLTPADGSFPGKRSHFPKECGDHFPCGHAQCHGNRFGGHQGLHLQRLHMLGLQSLKAMGRVCSCFFWVFHIDSFVLVLFFRPFVATQQLDGALLVVLLSELLRLSSHRSHHSVGFSNGISVAMFRPGQRFHVPRSSHGAKQGLFLLFSHMFEGIIFPFQFRHRDFFHQLATGGFTSHVGSKIPTTIPTKSTQPNFQTNQSNSHQPTSNGGGPGPTASPTRSWQTSCCAPR